MSHAMLLVALPGLPADIEAAVAEQMAPFNEDGGWFKEGSRWDWWVIGGRYEGRLLNQDAVRKGDLDLVKLRAHREASMRLNYAEALEAKETPPELRELIYGVKPGETEDAYIARLLPGTTPLAAYAFLHDKSWNEHERMGWWGAGAAPERAVETDGASVVLHEQDGARIVQWPGGEDAWREKFWERFIAPLPDDTTLVVVDFHV